LVRSFSQLVVALISQESLEVRCQVLARGDRRLGLLVVFPFQHRDVGSGLFVLGHGLVV